VVFKLVVPAIEEAEVGVSLLQASPGKVRERPYLENKFKKQKDWEYDLCGNLPHKCTRP
jgi:hypothetical protein